MAMVQRLRARFRVPADLLLPPPKKASASRPTKRAAAELSFDVCFGQAAANSARLFANPDVSS